MKRVMFFLLAFLMGLFLFSTPSTAIPIGPATLPSWHDSAQVQLGWVFDDPLNPQLTTPSIGWDKAIDGIIPVWDYDAFRVEYGNPAQWHILIPNRDEPNPVKNFWVSTVYEFDHTIPGSPIFPLVVWNPNNGYSIVSQVYELFTSGGVPTGDPLLASYGRYTGELKLYPNPSEEDLYLGTPPFPSYVDHPKVTEVYIKTKCPEPATMLLFCTGLMGIAAVLRKIQR